MDHQDEFIVSDKEMFGRISRLRDERKSFLKKQYEDAHICFSKDGEFTFGGDAGLGDSDYPQRK